MNSTSIMLRAQAASLKQDYPGWHFIVSSAGRIWAQRRLSDFGVLALAAEFGVYPKFEVYESVDGDTALEVREKIASKEGQ